MACHVMACYDVVSAFVLLQPCTWCPHVFYSVMSWQHCCPLVLMTKCPGTLHIKCFMVLACTLVRTAFDDDMFAHVSRPSCRYEQGFRPADGEG